VVTQVKHYINAGKSLAERADVFGLQSATGEQTGLLPIANAADVADAVAAATKAAPGWRRQRPCDDQDPEPSSGFSRTVSTNSRLSSSPSTESHSDRRRNSGGMEVVEFATAAPQLLKGELTENVGTRVDSYSMRQPSAWSPALPRSISPMVRCGCFPSRLPAATLHLEASEAIHRRH